MQSISIKKLFGQFDYDITFNQVEGITILTGPNGYGKTTILNIIYNLIKKNTSFFDTLAFEEIALFFNDNQKLIISRDGNNNVSLPCNKDLWLQNSNSVYFIRDQRLNQDVPTFYDGTYKHDGSITHSGITTVNAIEFHAKELSRLTAKKQSEERQLEQELNNSYPERLFKYSKPLSQEDFQKRFNALCQKQQQLQQFGIYPKVLGNTGYEDENRRALSVYLEDYEQKTAIYDDLLAKINLFLELLNQKRLNNKLIHVDSQRGYYFTTSGGQELKLTDLSSGEQQEIILLYELLFKTEKDTLVLIDEPETSMHVSWQHLFIKDLLEIAKINPVSFIVATHSPSLINDKWDLSVDLFDLANGKTEYEHDE